jgi:hypothetical protein
LPLLLNFAAFQLVWFLSLQGAGSGRHWQGSLAFLAFLGLQLALSAERAADVRLALCAAACGLVLDTLYVQAGLLDYAAPLPFAGIAPYWIVVMWANFGLTLNACLRWLQRKLWLAALCGAVGGPLAYLAGVKLGAAVVTAPPVVVYGALAAAWAAAVPGLLALARAWRRQT